MTELNEALSQLEPSDVVNAIIHRKSSSGDLIAYPTGTEFDDSDDGIHIPGTCDYYSELSDGLQSNQNSAYNLYILAKIRMQQSENNYPVAQTIDMIGVVGLSHSKSEESLPKKLIESVSESFSEYFELEDESHRPKKENKLRETDQKKELDASELPSSHPEKEMTYLYYLGTKSADCYHQNKQSRGLRYRQGNLHLVEKKIGGELPDEVSDLRKCHYCG